jgi:hypothetical protein
MSPELTESWGPESATDPDLSILIEMARAEIAMLADEADQDEPTTERDPKTSMDPRIRD